MSEQPTREIIIVGGGMAGLSAAIYLGRALRDTLVVDEGRSMAVWEPEVQNYLGFAEGVAGEDLVRRGRQQAERYHVDFMQDEIVEARVSDGLFDLRGREHGYTARRLLLATGIFHIPPEIEGLNECLGHSMFFCKDCDGFRVQEKQIAVYGTNDEAVEYALGMLVYSACVVIVTDGHEERWDTAHAKWIEEYEIPVYRQPIASVDHENGHIQTLTFADATKVAIDALFTTRGDIYFNELARDLGAAVDAEGQILVDHCLHTTVKGLYAAGCVTPANCQMIIAAGQGAIAAQAINRDLFEESLANHALRRLRIHQLRTEETVPAPAQC